MAQSNYEQIEAEGYNPRTTGVDVLLAAPVGVGLNVGYAMSEYPDDAEEDLSGFQLEDYYVAEEQD